MDHDTALGQSIEYFNGDKLAAGIFIDKYALTNPSGDILEGTPEAMHRRLARELARAESKYPNAMSEDFIFEHLDRFKYIVAQGSPMSGIGNPYSIQTLGNCYVLPSVIDSYGGILKTDQELVQLAKRRAGIGFDISNIRPRGLPTSNAAKTTDGIGLFMERFSNSCREVAQSGRRGALILSLSVHHPEIETFINIKKDRKKVTGANISIRFSDEFMLAVKENKEYQQRWPVDSKNPSVSVMVSARKIWEQFIEGAWDSAEPGCFFWDTILRRSPADSYAERYPAFKTISSNPCQPSWATVLTPAGVKTIGQVDIGDVIWSGKRWTKITNKVQTGVKRVNAYRTRAGTFFGTENHRIVSEGVKLEVKDAESIDISTGPALESNLLEALNPQDIMDGLVWGDGMTHKASNNLTVLLIEKDDQCYFESEIKDLIIEARPGIKQEAWLVKTNNECLPKTYNRKLNLDWMFEATTKQIRGFLRGLYSANGSVVSNRVTLKSSCFDLVEQVQQLLSGLGIQTYYTVNKSHDVEFSNGTYECKESYDLNIGSKRGRQLFSDLIGFIHPYKQEKLKEILKNTTQAKSKETYDIVDVQFLAEEMVYDLTVEADEHTYWTGGLLVSNCGEIVMGEDSCRLLLLNTLSYVKNPFTKNAVYDWDLWKKHVKVAQRLMDDVVDLELECLDRILKKIESDPEPEDVKYTEYSMWKRFKKTCEQGRRTGLGITALGDALAALGVTYGSEDSLDITENIYRCLAVEAYRCSVEMAKERGAFPIYDYSLEKDNIFINQIMDEDETLKENWKKYGRRNIALTTTAPAGSVSTLTQTSSGIEPVFELIYTRRRKIMSDDKNIRVDFTDDLGDKWQEFKVYHPQFKNWMDISGKTEVEDSPWWKSRSSDVSWEAGVRLQAAAQKWICHSISKTCNLPKEATKELVSECYMTAYDSGCKGFTIYRYGSRAGVLITEPKEETSKQERSSIVPPPGASFLDRHAPRRPTELACDISTTTVKGEKWTFFIGLHEDRPYEIMGGLSKYISIPKRIKEGKIIKHNGEINPIPRYDLHYDFQKSLEDETIVKDIAAVFDNATNAAFTRTISLALRHGTPVQFVVEQLLKGSEKEDDLFSFSRAVSRVLKSYIKDGTKTSAIKVCTACGSPDLAYQEGCLSCKSCGFSKCS